MTYVPPPDLNAWNKQVIEEFRAAGGRRGTTVLLHTTGAKSGLERVNPMASMKEDDVLYVFAANAGAPKHPDWYLNLVAHPDVTVEYDGETFEATATPLEGEEDARVRAIQVAGGGMFNEHQSKTTRVIPIVKITRK